MCGRNKRVLLIQRVSVDLQSSDEKDGASGSSEINPPAGSSSPFVEYDSKSDTAETSRALPVSI
jgi:hypothetical protein